LKLAAVDSENVPVIIPRVIPQTEHGMALFEGGHERRLKRLNRRQELISLVNASQQTAPIIQVQDE
jgi:hypothetical protein